MMSHTETFMRRCQNLAEQAMSLGDPAVGAVIVRDGRVIAEARDQVKSTRDVAAHAELSAVRLAFAALETLDLTGCTLYTNVEPCWMCSYAIRESRISQVIIGAAVDSISGVTSRYPILTDGQVDGWSAPPSIAWLRPEAERNLP